MLLFLSSITRKRHAAEKENSEDNASACFVSQAKEQSGHGFDQSCETIREDGNILKIEKPIGSMTGLEGYQAPHD